MTKKTIPRAVAARAPLVLGLAETPERHGVTHRPAQADRPAPVLRHDRCVAQVERLEQRVEPVGVPWDPVELAPVGLIAAVEAEIVGHYHAVPGLGERTDEELEGPPRRSRARAVVADRARSGHGEGVITRHVEGVGASLLPPR